MQYSTENFVNIVNRTYHDINPINCGNEMCAPSHSYGPAVREYWLLHFVVSGNGVFRTQRGSYSLSENEIFIIKPYEVTYYEADKDEPWEYIWIGFTSNIEMPELLLQNDTAYAPYLKNCFQDVKKIVKYGKDNAYADFLCSKAWEIVARTRSLESKVDKPSAERYVKDALDIMKAEFHRGISVNEIAELLHLNRSYFSTVFYSVMKVSAKDYLMKLKMERAGEMLRSKQYTVSIVAISVGFSDISTFSRSFKAYFGISPKDYTGSR